MSPKRNCQYSLLTIVFLNTQVRQRRAYGKPRCWYVHRPNGGLTGESQGMSGTDLDDDEYQRDDENRRRGPHKHPNSRPNRKLERGDPQSQPKLTTAPFSNAARKGPRREGTSPLLSSSKGPRKPAPQKPARQPPRRDEELSKRRGPRKLSNSRPSQTPPSKASTVPRNRKAAPHKGGAPAPPKSKQSPCRSSPQQVPENLIDGSLVNRLRNA